MEYKARHIRYLILLLILLAVAWHEAWVKLSVASWDRPLIVRISAINGDSRKATARYIASQKNTEYQPLADFINREAKRYGLDQIAVNIEYAGLLEHTPPQPPLRGSVLDNIVWSLRFRLWAVMRSFDQESSNADVDLFVIFYDPATIQTLPHSVGLRGGMIGLINAFASRDYRGSNQLVIGHELMHTLGATDKYNAANLPSHPRGYAEPYRTPLHPQSKAEIMGGRIPLNARQARIPESLRQVLIGIYTAAEISWPVE